jgi:Zn-dependent peptidase ImmA (M78 family)
MLRWARDWRGRTLQEAADRIGKTPAIIERWETPIADVEQWVKTGPTVKQARELADFYERSFLEFFRANPPELAESELVPDYRMQQGATPNLSEIRELKVIQSWAEEKRINALDLFEEIGEAPPNVPDALFAANMADHETAAENARRVIEFDIGDQFAIKSKDRDQLPNIIRKKIERAGILVLRRSDLHDYGARGICIVADRLPIIVYGSESAGAQAFTLSHELGHVCLRQSAISGPRRRDTPFNVESWCDRFSASFLMPRDAMRAALGAPPTQPAPNIDDQELSALAIRFRVSQHAMCIRLVHLGYLDAAHYWGVKKPLFDAIEANRRTFGRPKYYGRRYETSVGDLYTGLVLEAWNSGRITNHNAAEYMGIKNFEHLNDIRSNFGSS